MTTLTLELTDEQAQKSAEEAKRLNLPMQDLAARRLFTPWKSDEGGVALDFQAAVDYVFQKNSELYRRLSTCTKVTGDLSSAPEGLSPNSPTF
jgi:hypothetical protein